ncbi:probable pectinesterase/pectinesterase inhibitor 64 [Musa acuminata AAA Group]|uniref:probable pectinesterase/pectinesterase inhibitor 64 n=1 Tax=Musa acuminata AAA Group TaxID=214697 RepID=UPI0031DE0D9F
MVAALQSYGSDISLWAPPQAERDGYWPDATSASPSGEAARKELPRPGTPPDATVCKEGRCQFRAVQAAVDAALIDGTFDHSLSLSFVTDHGVSGDGFKARDLAFANTAGPDKHQAVAFRSDSDLSVLESVEFLGHQDTLYAHSLRQFYKSCRISGTSTSSSATPPPSSATASSSSSPANSTSSTASPTPSP